MPPAPAPAARSPVGIVVLTTQSLGTDPRQALPQDSFFRAPLSGSHWGRSWLGSEGG